MIHSLFVIFYRNYAYQAFLTRHSLESPREIVYQRINVTGNLRKIWSQGSCVYMYSFKYQFCFLLSCLKIGVNFAVAGEPEV